MPGGPGVGPPMRGGRVPPNAPPQAGGGGGGGGGGGPIRQSPVRTAPAVGRARGVSGMVGVGEAGGMMSEAEAAEAESALRSGDAFRPNAYADSAQDFAVANT